MNQPIDNRPTFNICNSSLAHSLLYHMNYKIDQHGTSDLYETVTDHRNVRSGVSRLPLFSAVK